MIKEAIDRILELQDPTMVELDKVAYVKHGYVATAPPFATAITLKSLHGIVDYLETNVDQLDYKDLIVHVKDYKTVRVLSKLADVHRQREKYALATYERPHWAQDFGVYMDIEDFRIWMMTDFQDTEDRQAILRLVGNISDSKVAESKDDGVSQAVATRVGIAKVEAAMVPNPVKLQPFRTFIESEQPVSDFLLRMRSRVSHDQLPHVALFEADGGGWKQQAMQLVFQYLKDALPEDIAILA